MQRGPGLSRWWMLLMVIFVAACSAGGKASTTPVAHATATSAPIVAVATTPPGVHPTPVSGAWSVYVDPTFGYSFQYPSNWTVQPAIGQNESDVTLSEPLSDPNDPNYPVHPWTQLLVRATDDFTETFVNHLLCFSTPDTQTKVDGYPTVDLSTDGGDPVNGYTAPAFGLAFFARDKNLATEIWLQSSAKDPEIGLFIDYGRPIWAHVLRSFKVGSASKLVSDC